ncbi:MAG: histidine kinase [Komarekiella atlantica HA4396-MV6]|jgi:hypothetical protein|nr:histidine kinase [Komarekiella atlantica HA4396-MV6]
MVIGIHRRAVGVFTHRRNAEHALHELRDSGFAMDRVSVVVQDANHNDDIAGAEVRERVGDKADEGATLGALSGGALGGLTGLLVGLGTLAIPGIGPIMLAGATATALATTVAGVGIGAAAGGLLGALIGLGIPEERARVYNERVERGHYLVIIDGTDTEIAKAEAILQHRGIEEFGIYDHPDRQRETIDVTRTTPKTAILNRGNSLTKNAVGHFSKLSDAEVAINDLRAAGFPLSQISLVHRDFSQSERLTSFAVSDRFDAMRLGLPDERARFFSDRITQGDYVIIINGTDDQLRQAASIVSRHGIQEWQIYDPTLISSTSHNYANDTSESYDQGVYQQTAIFDNTYNSEDPTVIIVDRRDETV